MSPNLSLFITFLLGLFLVVGIIFSFFLNKKRRVLDYIFALAFSLLIMLMIFDLLKESLETFGFGKLYLFIIFALVGFLIFKILDQFIPDHHDHVKNNKEIKENIHHIGLLSIIVLIIHNIIEGMAIYFVTLSDLSLGLMMSIGVGIHNLPLGVMIGSVYSESSEKKSLTIPMILLSISTFLGGLIPFLLKLTSASNIFMGILLSLVLGMLFYLVFFELLPKVKDTKNKDMTIYGLVSGVLIFLLTLFFDYEGFDVFYTLLLVFMLYALFLYWLFNRNNLLFY